MYSTKKYLYKTASLEIIIHKCVEWWFCLSGFSFQSFATFYHICTIHPFVWSVPQIVRSSGIQEWTSCRLAQEHNKNMVPNVNLPHFHMNLSHYSFIVDWPIFLWFAGDYREHSIVSPLLPTKQTRMYNNQPFHH